LAVTNTSLIGSPAASRAADAPPPSPGVDDVSNNGAPRLIAVAVIGSASRRREPPRVERAAEPERAA
jgi:hypothetical protein